MIIFYIIAWYTYVSFSCILVCTCIFVSNSVNMSFITIVINVTRIIYLGLLANFYHFLSQQFYELHLIEYIDLPNVSFGIVTQLKFPPSGPFFLCASSGVLAIVGVEYYLYLHHHIHEFAPGTSVPIPTSGPLITKVSDGQVSCTRCVWYVCTLKNFDRNHLHPYSNHEILLV